MSNFSRLTDAPEAQPGASSGRVMAILFGAGLCLAFGLAQLHLQFALSDLQRETTKLQARKLELRSQINSIRGEVESQKQGDRLLRYAQAELGMIQAPAQADRIALARDAFALPGGATARPASPAEREPAAAKAVASHPKIDGKAVAAGEEKP